MDFAVTCAIGENCFTRLGAVIFRNRLNNETRGNRGNRGGYCGQASCAHPNRSVVVVAVVLAVVDATHAGGPPPDVTRGVTRPLADDRSVGRAHQPVVDLSVRRIPFDGHDCRAAEKHNIIYYIIIFRCAQIHHIVGTHM